MKFRAGQRRKATEYEKAISEWWKKNKVFEQSVKDRPIDKSYVFYDGPPFITGNPHHGTLLSSVVKDAVPRFWTMQGYRVERRWGWDCHGLPAENFVEKQLGITDRREIGTKWSLEEYIIKARESMVANSETWRAVIDRVGRWVDFDNCYRTMNKDFMESVWWAFKQLYDAGKIYEGRKVLMYDTKFATPVSKAEVTMDNDAYQTVTDPSAYVKFRLVEPEAFPCEAIRDNGSEVSEEPRSARPLGREWPKANGRDEAGRTRKCSGSSDLNNIYFLAWTTTPWTLMANRALAVSPDLEYVAVKVKAKKTEDEIGDQTQDEIYIVAKKLVEKVFKDKDYEIVSANKITGADFAATSYYSTDGSICQVFTADFVGDSEGTGIVHIAPAYGEDDYKLYLEHQNEMGFVDTLDENGYYLPEYAEKLHEIGVRDTDEHGIQIWAGNKFIAKCLEEKGIIYKIEYIQHEYPFNPRSKERIMYRAFPSWFFDIEGQKSLMLAENEHINWFPEYLKHGRFAKNIEAAPDWNLSRDRFWATAMPVWKSEEGTVLVIGSYDELEKYSGQRLDDYHRPWVDELEFDAYVLDGRVTSPAGGRNASFEGPKTWASAPERPEKEAFGQDPLVDGTHLEHFKRIEKVLDCWFESGSMPFAELHYPFENREKFEANYPADFIVEYVGQVRAWFYYVHTVNTALAEIGAFGEKAKKGHKNAFKNVITTGTLAGNDGRKMSKSLGNYTDPTEMMDQYSADALRLQLLSSPVLSGEDFALIDKDVSDVARKLSMIWNVYDFFTTYAEIEGIDSAELTELNSSSPLDIWILSRLRQLGAQITEGMKAYNIPQALSGVLPFIDDLSNWFVRRSRRRFSKNEDLEDKKSAFSTLYQVLIQLAKLLAPFTPFLSEELYQKLTGEDKSVHLEDWPKLESYDEQALDLMTRTRAVITDALALRMQKSESEQQIKVRQPLSKLTYGGEKLPEFYEQIIMDEVNVKEVVNGDALELDKTLTSELLREGYARELIRAIQAARKHAKLSLDDRISLSLSVSLPEGYEDLVLAEVLADSFVKNGNFSHDEIVKIGDENITISLEKV